MGATDLSLLDQALERSARYLLTHHQQALNAGRFDVHHALALLGTDFNVPLASLGIAQQEPSTDDTTSTARILLSGAAWTTTGSAMPPTTSPSTAATGPSPWGWTAT
ncbi:MAG: hypothetical protein OXI08_11420 [Cyanobacteria bacterium MAG IRC4_bin_6]|nr:hypothetical protein [Cyanobacteria bacterium MAG IRC3_bin_20]MDE0648619.1 hypothetical protein [Cyanobacteria bacterium MAG IRC4_bin_6]